ncbi:MAG: POTRA domain-containing protein, partial [Terriglobales bacterium]
MRVREVLIHALMMSALASGFAAYALPRSGAGDVSVSQATAGAEQNLGFDDVLVQYQNLKIREILFPDVPKSWDQNSLLQLLPLKTGEPLDRENIRKSIRILFATKRFADIQIAAERAGSDEVSISIETVSNYFIGEVRVEGEPNRPASGQIVNASKLQLGELYTQEKVDAGLKNIQQLMNENGYYRSSVKVEETKQEDAQQITVVFSIKPGEQAHVGQVNVIGSQIFSRDEIEDITKMHAGDPVTVQRVSGALDRLRKKYQKQNRWLAQAAISKRTYRPTTNAVDFDFTIDAGPMVSITAEGFKISRSVLKQDIPVYEENALDDDLLNEGRRNLLNYLQARGYFEAKVSYTKKSDPTGAHLRIIYDVDAGPVHKLVKVEISGSMNHDKGLPEEMLRSHMQTVPAGRLLSHGRYSQALLYDDVKTLETLYRANGFEQVKITSRVADDYEGKKNVLAVFVDIEVGRQTIVGALHIVGNNAKLQEPFPVLNTAVGQAFADSKIADDREI